MANSKYHTLILTFIVVFSFTSNEVLSQIPPLFDIQTFTGDYHTFIVAINNNDTLAIRSLVKDNRLDPNFIEPRNGISLLWWALANKKLLSCKSLLNVGANPNLLDSNLNIPVVTRAASISENSDYLRLMLEHGGNPNLVSMRKSNEEISYAYASPLCAAATASLENVKLLISYGADVDLSPFQEALPLTNALITKKIDVAQFLIINAKADVKRVYIVNIDKDTLNVCDLLRECVFKLDSKEYHTKMEIVNYIKHIGFDYRSSRIPRHLRAKFPKDYLEKY